MPLVNIALKEQITAASAGKRTYPELGQVVRGTILSDNFDRETLNPTNAIALYTVATVGTGTGDLANNAALTLLTSGAAADNVSVRTSGIQFSRVSQFVDDRSQIELDIVFVWIGAVTSIQTFLGFLLSGAAIAAPPTTVRHMGFYVDTAAQATVILSSSNGTTQNTSNTNFTPVAGTVYRLNILFGGDNAATITFYSGTNLNTSEGSLAVTALGGATPNVSSYSLHFFHETLAIATREIRINEWSVKVV